MVATNVDALTDTFRPFFERYGDAPAYTVSAYDAPEALECFEQCEAKAAAVGLSLENSELVSMREQLQMLVEIGENDAENIAALKAEGVL